MNVREMIVIAEASIKEDRMKRRDHESNWRKWCDLPLITAQHGTQLLEGTSAGEIDKVNER